MRRFWQRHTHQWQRVATTYAPPYGGVHVKGWGYDLGAVIAAHERSVAGVTSVLYECATCHQTKVVEMLGKQEQA